jgi:hypothetical protein
MSAAEVTSELGEALERGSQTAEARRTVPRRQHPTRTGVRRYTRQSGALRRWRS